MAKKAKKQLLKRKQLKNPQKKAAKKQLKKQLKRSNSFQSFEEGVSVYRDFFFLCKWERIANHANLSICKSHE